MGVKKEAQNGENTSMHVSILWYINFNSLPTNDGVCRHDAMRIKRPMTAYAVMKNDRALAVKRHARESPQWFDVVIMN